MAHHFSRETLEQIVAEKGGSPAPSQYLFSNNTFRPPPAPRDVRCDIYNAVYSAGRASRADIAKALGVKKAPWLCVHIECLVTEGYLVKIEGVEKNGALKYFYEVAGS